MPKVGPLAGRPATTQRVPGDIACTSRDDQWVSSVVFQAVMEVLRTDSSNIRADGPVPHCAFVKQVDQVAEDHLRACW